MHIMARLVGCTHVVADLGFLVGCFGKGLCGDPSMMMVLEMFEYRFMRV